MSNLQDFIDQRFGGVLSKGSHDPNGVACANEAESQYLGREWTDKPEKLRIFDLRVINDAPWSSDEQRTRHLVPLVDAMRGSRDWPVECQCRWADTVVVETVRQVIAELPKLDDQIRQQCREATTAEEARAAARAARAARDACDAADDAVAAAADAADAARAAADAADAAGAAARAAGVARAACDAAVATGAAAGAAAAAARAADAAARDTAGAAADAGAAAGPDHVLITACRIWIDAAERSQKG